MNVILITLRFTNYKHRAIKNDKVWFMIYLTGNFI